jgi:hypothetical protein
LTGWGKGVLSVRKGALETAITTGIRTFSATCPEPAG